MVWGLSLIFQLKKKVLNGYPTCKILSFYIRQPQDKHKNEISKEDVPSKGPPLKAKRVSFLPYEGEKKMKKIEPGGL